MLRLSPSCLITEGSATGWFQAAHNLSTLQNRLEQALESYMIEGQVNDNRGRMVLEAIVFSILLDENMQLHGNLGVEIKGGVRPRDPHSLSHLQVNLRDLATGTQFAALSFAYNEAFEMWDGFEIQEVV